MRVSFLILHGTSYIPVPVNCQVLEMIITPIADAGAAGSVTLSHGSTAVNVASAAGIAAAALVTGTPDTTNGKLTFVKGTTPLKFVVTSTNSVAFGVTLDLDGFCRG